MGDFSLSIQVTPWSVLNEGIDPALDFLAECGLDAIHLNTHTYYGAGQGNGGDTSVWAPDHLPSTRWQGHDSRAWIDHDPRRYAEVGLFHLDPGVDHFQAISEAARSRGMAVFARYLDGWEMHRHRIEGWRDVLCVSPEGARLRIPCFSNPRVREWSRLTMEDIGAVPGLAGLLYGIERCTPLDDVLHTAETAYCCCEHCRKGAEEIGFDFARVVEGLRELKRWAARFRDEPAWVPEQDPLTWLYEFHHRFPELHAFDRLHADNLLAVEREASSAFKSRSPEGAFAGLAHPASRWSKALPQDFDRRAQHLDVLAPRLYDSIEGARLVQNVRERDRLRYLRCYSEAMRWEAAWRCSVGPGWPVPDPDQIFEQGIPTEIPTAKVAGLVRKYGETHSVHALVGVDITHPFRERRPTPPDYVERICEGAVTAGASGVVLCREYQEISGASIRAARRALDRLNGSTQR